MKITQISAEMILDSRGCPTIQSKIGLEDGTISMASVPSGASTGTFESHELRDKNPKLFDGKSVNLAIEKINSEISKALVGTDPFDQTKIDQTLIELDGTADKSRLGANSILAVSIGICRAAAKSKKQSLYKYIGQFSGFHQFFMPKPMFLMLEGGKHGNFATDIQEFMIIPQKPINDLAELLNSIFQITEQLRSILSSRNYSIGLGLEGAFCPIEIKSNIEAIKLITQAISQANYQPGQDFAIALDFASSEFFQNGNYVLKSEGNKLYSPAEWTKKIEDWVNKYPIVSIEDPHQEELWEHWTNLVNELNETQIVGDDLVTTNVSRIQKAVEQKAMTSLIIKPNQIGTISETVQAVQIAKNNNLKIVVSHRAGETNDDFIADFCIGVGSDQCKFGGLNKGERIAKYNRLLIIEKEINSNATN